MLSKGYANIIRYRLKERQQERSPPDVRGGRWFRFASVLVIGWPVGSSFTYAVDIGGDLFCTSAGGIGITARHFGAYMYDGRGGGVSLR